jgi:hypothetical protein
VQEGLVLHRSKVPLTVLERPLHEQPVQVVVVVVVAAIEKDDARQPSQCWIRIIVLAFLLRPQ